jgi:hypothetical protein
VAASFGKCPSKTQIQLVIPVIEEIHHFTALFHCIVSPQAFITFLKSILLEVGANATTKFTVLVAENHV